MPYRSSYANSRRISKAQFMALTPAQRAAKSRAVNGTNGGKRVIVRRSKAPTTGGRTIRNTLLKTVPLYPVSKMQYGQLYYDYYKSMTYVAGGNAGRVFSANGAYDPDISGIGHQPMGFDQMMAIYEQFVVLRSHIKVTFISASDATRVAIYLSPDPTLLGPAQLMENGLLKTEIVCGTTDAGTHRMKTIELTCDIPKYFGKTRDDIIADPQMYGTIAANPGEQVYFNIAAWDPFSSSAEGNVFYDVTISYDIYYWEPKKLTGS